MADAADSASAASACPRATSYCTAFSAQFALLRCSASPSVLFCGSASDTASSSPRARSYSRHAASTSPRLYRAFAASFTSAASASRDASLTLSSASVPFAVLASTRNCTHGSVLVSNAAPVSSGAVASKVCTSGSLRPPSCPISCPFVSAGWPCASARTE